MSVQKKSLISNLVAAKKAMIASSHHTKPTTGSVVRGAVSTAVKSNVSNRVSTAVRGSVSNMVSTAVTTKVRN
jgi:hypothetical protein